MIVVRSAEYIQGAHNVVAEFNSLKEATHFCIKTELDLTLETDQFVEHWKDGVRFYIAVGEKS